MEIWRKYHIFRFPIWVGVANVDNDPSYRHTCAGERRYRRTQNGPHRTHPDRPSTAQKRRAVTPEIGWWRPGWPRLIPRWQRLHCSNQGSTDFLWSWASNQPWYQRDGGSMADQRALSHWWQLACGYKRLPVALRLHPPPPCAAIVNLAIGLHKDQPMATPAASVNLTWLNLICVTTKLRVTKCAATQKKASKCVTNMDETNFERSIPISQETISHWSARRLQRKKTKPPSNKY